jgi:hypothetical protein
MKASKLFLAVVLSVAFLEVTTFARVGEPPLSRIAKVKSLAGINQLVVTPTDVKAELESDKRAGVVTPLRFATATTISVTPQTHGTWENVTGGRLWRLRVHSAGATDLNLGITQFWLPEGATLHIWSEGEDYFQGPYEANDNQEHRQLWTPVIPGDRAVIELFVPNDAKDEPVLLLSQVNRGYRDVFHRAKDLPGEEKAGACNIDVICSQADAWRNEIRSVARYSVGGTSLCTGQLVNNTANDNRAFFLTANHCGISAGNAPSVVVYWNFQSPTCGQHGGGSLAQNQSGATFRMAKADVDVTLIELNAIPSSSFNVYYSGWDRSNSTPPGAVGIHHPSGDEKSICFSSNTLSTVNSCIGTGGSLTHWQVVWTLGITEPGSSGSGIWDPRTHQLIGVLSGGGSACSSPFLPDCYGKFSAAWDSGATPAARLREWLDPLNTGVLSLNGRNPGGSGVYDIARDFSTNSNPNGVWSYGWQSTVGGTFNLITSSQTSAADNGVRFAEWVYIGGAPVFQFYPFTNTVTGVSDGGQGQYPPGTVAYYAGFNNTPQNFATIRFTAPGTGNYAVQVRVQSYLNGPSSGDADFHVARNGIDVYGFNVPPNSATWFTNILALSNGSTVDFIAGRGADNLQPGSGFMISGVVFLTNTPPPAVPQIVGVGSSITSESCTPTNRAVDPGETVSVNFTLRNIGGANADVIATLLPGNGVISPSGPQSYGTLTANGASVARGFSFTAGGNCGGIITNTLQLQSGGSNIGTLTFTWPLGAQFTRLSQSFDAVTPPNLPANWINSAVGSTGWSTTSSAFNTPSNSVFASDLASPSDATLTSPSFPVSSTNAQLSFAHKYNTEYGFDGGILEISLNGGPFREFVSAGGVFNANGYNFFIDSNPTWGSAIAGSNAWTGNSTNFVTTTALLPPSAANNNARLRWRMVSDGALAATGWNVDTVLVTERNCCRSGALPLILNVRRQGSAIVFSYDTRVGINYGIDYKDSINAPWTTLTTDTGDGTRHSITNTLIGVQRFFRLREQ